MMVYGGGEIKDLMTHLSAIIPPMLCPTRKRGRDGCLSFDIIVIIITITIFIVISVNTVIISNINTSRSNIFQSSVRDESTDQTLPLKCNFVTPGNRSVVTWTSIECWITSST